MTEPNREPGGDPTAMPEAPAAPADNAKEGPSSYTSQVHSCPKVRYRTFGNLLTSLGVKMLPPSRFNPSGLTN